MKRFVLVLLAGQAMLAGLSLQAEPVGVGDAIPPITAKDQHGVNYAFTNGTAYLLIARDMDSAKAANKKLGEQGAGFLEKHRAIYLMDIHTMPGIARVFALPKMRKYPQRIVLIKTANSMDWVPVKAGRVTVLKLTPEGRVGQISYWQAASEPAGEIFR